MLSGAPSAHAAYNLARDYSGSDLFSQAQWDYYGYWGFLTLGDVNYLDGPDALSQKLVYVTTEGTGIIKVDNTTNVASEQKRNSIRITSKDIYPVGSLWIIDAVHLPFGCSVWPSIWTTGEPWPQYGEIDIIEAVNLMGNNQYAIHSDPGCTKTDPTTQTGTSSGTDCSQGAGCMVAETQANSYGSGFAQAGGGVFAAQFDSSGIYIWFWSRPNVPAAISQAASANSSTLDISTFGNPSAAFPGSSCDIGTYFGAQKLVLDITLCGDWAGVPAIYNETCASAGTAGICYGNNVIGAGSPQYDDAYFELNYIKGYTLDSVSLLSSSSQNYSSPSSATSTGAALTSATSTGVATATASSAGNSANSAGWARGIPGGGLVAVAGVVMLGLSVL
ncbi:glycoside hydrolase family 16 protein [Athelia psychrophila]|uniref:Glycoside hydrolase family 16 protein n=1 Tax=Athelia psychrophila TaxID=1759441 RepID=A0A167VUB2_9AGAM|nr:glycoside hydrolase family 16 protein [Fibularhizoctonia sp. CBS 109695]KZP33222.1 glycoside hydrolase family 16 protein [Fibularhizoctonia sp. CBS 109695]